MRRTLIPFIALAVASLSACAPTTIVGSLETTTTTTSTLPPAPTGDVKELLPRPDPEAQAPVVADEPVAQDAPEPRAKPKYEFYDVLRDKEVVIPDAELTAQAQAEAAAAADATPPQETTDGVRYLLQAGAFRSAADAEALKARIALTGEVARVESAEIEGGTIHRVRLGPYPNAGSLAAAKQALDSHGIQAMAIRAQ